MTNLTTTLRQADAAATWEAGAPAWVAWLDAWGPWAFLALFVALVARAWLRRARYRAVHELGPADRDVVRRAVAEAERRTTGEIVPVVLERCDPHPGALWLAALVTALVGSVLLEGVLPWDWAPGLLACQAGLGALGWLVARALPDVQRLFVSAARADEVCEEQALQEFARSDVHRTADGTGVLILVSLLEHRVVVLADEGVARAVGPEPWSETRDAVLAGIREGSLRAGLVAGIERCGAVLAEHFPWTEGDRDELPDHLVVRRE